MTKPLSDAEIYAMLQVFDTSMTQMTQMEQELLTFQEHVQTALTQTVSLADRLTAALKMTGLAEEME